MKLWHLWRTNRDDVGYDEYDAFIVQARNERDAREIACGRCGDEGGVWRDAAKVRCEELVPSGDQSCVILGSFNAG